MRVSLSMIKFVMLLATVFAGLFAVTGVVLLTAKWGLDLTVSSVHMLSLAMFVSTITTLGVVGYTVFSKKGD